MIPLLTAIDTFITGNSAINAVFTSGYFRDRAPTGTKMPYLISGVVAAPNTEVYGGTSWSPVTVRFTGYGYASVVGPGMDTFIAQMAEQVFSLSSGQIVNATRKTQPIPQITPDVDQLGNDIWRADVIYEFSTRGAA